jgi:Phage integrase family
MTAKRPQEEVAGDSQKTELLWFRQYDLRHTAITRLAEADAPLSVIKSMVGHVSEKMREHYTHISTAAKSHVLREVQNFRERKPRFQVPPAIQAPGSFAGSNAPLFREAEEVYISSRALVDASGMPFSRFGPHYIRQATLNNFRRYVCSLSLFFGEMRLSEIRLAHIRKCQRARALGDESFIRYRRPRDAKPHKLPNWRTLPRKGNTTCPAKPMHVNQELATLEIILRRDGVWDRTFDDYYEELEEIPNSIPRALMKGEQRKWLET